MAWLNLVNKDLDTMYRWLRDTSLYVNIEYIIFGTKHQINSSNDVNTKVKINNISS